MLASSAWLAVAGRAGLIEEPAQRVAARGQGVRQVVALKPGLNLGSPFSALEQFKFQNPDI